MKNILLVTAAAVALAGAAQADVSFVKGEASISYNQIADVSDFSLIESGVSAAFSMGTYGVQFGGNNDTYSFGSDPSITFSSTNAHLYHQAENGNKYGAYVGTGGFVFGGTVYGVEGMFELGSLDVEAYAGVMMFGGTSELGLAGVGVFYEISPGIEVNAAYDNVSFTSGGPSIDAYSLGASYDIPNTNRSATASYESAYDGDLEMYGLGIKWNFGPDQSERLFGSRDIPISLF